jgi:hypothetical protein
MEIQELQKFAVDNFSQYFAVTIDTLVSPRLHFAPVAVPANMKWARAKNGRAGSVLNPQLAGYAVLSMFLGLALNSLVTKHPDGEGLVVIEVVGLLFWFLYASLVHLFCRIARGNGSFLETVSVTVQVLATLYVVCSLVSTTLAMLVLLKPVNTFIAGLGGLGAIVADNPVVLFFVIHTILFLYYLPRALKPVHHFNLLQEIAVALPTGILVLLHGVAMVFLTGYVWSVIPPAAAFDGRIGTSETSFLPRDAAEALLPAGPLYGG